MDKKILVTFCCQLDTLIPQWWLCCYYYLIFQYFLFTDFGEMMMMQNAQMHQMVMQKLMIGNLDPHWGHGHGHGSCSSDCHDCHSGCCSHHNYHHGCGCGHAHGTVCYDTCYPVGGAVPSRLCTTIVQKRTRHCHICKHKGNLKTVLVLFWWREYLITYEKQRIKQKWCIKLKKKVKKKKMIL